MIEWFFEVNPHIEKTTLKGGNVLAHVVADAAQDFELYAAIVYDVFNVDAEP